MISAKLAADIEDFASRLEASAARLELLELRLAVARAECFMAEVEMALAGRSATWALRGRLTAALVRAREAS